MTLEDIKQYKDQLQSIGKKYGIQSIKVFGSTVRNEADHLSDIDLLVEIESGRSLFDLGGFQMDVRELMKTDVDVVTEKGLKDRIRQSVLTEAVEL